MPNFYDDNPDLRFNLDQAPLAEIARLREHDFAEAGQYPYAPRDAADAVENYHETLRIVGDIAGDFIAPRAEEVDREGAKWHDGVVTYAQGTREALDRLSGADLMGFTLPRKYGGLYLPHTTYAAAIEMVSRGDAALMTLFGLGDIAETILRFASEELKDKYLPRFATGEATGAMVLTEPDAGSDLQAVRLKASPDPADPNLWRLNGVKRFITNGCGDILLVLARSEEGTRDGRGLSLFLAEKGPGLRVRRIEDKLGIHGSPTCELQFTHCPAYLVGRRRFGLIKYTMDLMNGARLAIAAQSVGICEAAYREALAYAHSREQFGKAIVHFPALADLLVGMRLKLELARTLTIDCGVAVDFEKEYENRPADKALYKKWHGYASSLTPMAKYYASEAAVELSNSALAVLGGSGFMRDYPIERYLRDARITNIYEGTSQLQVVAILAGLLGGDLDSLFADFAARPYTGATAKHLPAVTEALGLFNKAMDYVKQRAERDYTDLVARHLADMAIDVYNAFRLMQFGEVSESKALLADLFVPAMGRRVRAAHDAATSGNRLVLDEYRVLLAAEVH
ncbi:MAG TPA: acyl-CoA dehydrogenase family protein [Planctomycetota bacterium]|nr:acyl-CoA dehydrogenase family protein [Planctomycetota bacterium]HRR79986.1 acyl-CoA dehydrogenase family protein [Planctomycetota bacterium]